MKILYAIQGTGNGHLSRAMDVAPALEKHGNVDYFISGAQADIDFPYEVKYKSKGLSFYFGTHGGIDYSRTLFKNSATRLYKELKSFPIDDYDLIINDFEPISAWAAKFKGKKCIALSHQSALLGDYFPKPEKTDLIGETILKNYAPAERHYGFHFESKGDFIFTPIVRKRIRQAKVRNDGHYSVYLPAYSDEKILNVLKLIPEVSWQVFSKHTKTGRIQSNVTISPIDNERFVESITSCEGVLCGAGFETPSEALFLGKKVMVIPMKNQYEQHCNAMALANIGVPVFAELSKKYVPEIREVLDGQMPKPVEYPDETEEVVDLVIRREVENVS
ncbi:MAG: glycosyltransferase family protein [Bacteroidota bacterium]